MKVLQNLLESKKHLIRKKSTASNKGKISPNREIKQIKSETRKTAHTAKKDTLMKEK